MAGRGLGRALLGSGLLAVTLLGGAGGYGLGLVTTEQASAGTGASPLAPDSTDTPVATPPPKKLVPDTSDPLQADDIHYKTRKFKVASVFISEISMRVPSTWEMVLLVPPKDVKFNEPARKRAVRVQGGFTISRSPAASLAARIAQFNALSADKMVSIKSQDVDPVTNNATLIYNYADPESNTLKLGMIRWVANGEGLCILEIAVTGLPQDKAALEDILDHASDSATRSDSPLN